MWMFKDEAVRQNYVHQDQLLTSLTTFIELLSHCEGFLRTTAEDFARAHRESQESRKDRTTRAVLGGLCGASLGGTLGAVGGSAAGALGAVGAASVYSEDLNVVSASTGFFGAVMGGAAGATFAGALGGTLGAGAEVSGSSVDSNVYRIVWSILGGITGARIGHIFGGKVGIAGGAFGGALGGLLSVSATVDLIKRGLGSIKDVHQSQNSPKQKTDAKTDSVLHTFKQNTSPLVAELLIIHSSSQMDGRSEAVSVEAQSSECLRVLDAAERALSHLQYSPENTSCLEKASGQCKQVYEACKRMKSEAQKLLASWSK